MATSRVLFINGFFIICKFVLCLQPTSPGSLRNHCHHADLRGGWALAKQNQSGSTSVETYAPSCYQCHGVKWDKTEPQETTITYPGDNESWHTGQIVMIEWVGQQTDSITLSLYIGDQLKQNISDTILNGGSLRDIIVSESWGTGDNFYIKWEDTSGKKAWSNQFTITQN